MSAAQAVFGRFSVLLSIVLVAAPWVGAGAADSASADAGAPAAGGDWDWGGFTGLEDAPVTRSSTVSRHPAVPDVPRVGETAAPDFDAPARRAYAMFLDVPPFEVIPSQKDPGMHPCSNCHQWVLSDPRPRRLKRPHDNFELKHGLHGKGKFWCFTCHDLSGNGSLKTLEGEKLDYDDAYLLCSQCHVDQARDWVYGAHGKRVSGWQGRRQVLNCTACHYQHRPALKARAPEDGPRIRMGLQRPTHWVAKHKRPEQEHVTRAMWKTEAAGQEETRLEATPDLGGVGAAQGGGDEES